MEGGGSGGRQGAGEGLETGLRAEQGTKTEQMVGVTKEAKMKAGSREEQKETGPREEQMEVGPIEEPMVVGFRMAWKGVVAIRGPRAQPERTYTGEWKEGEAMMET